jgi:hypothetical protein
MRLLPRSGYGRNPIGGGGFPKNTGLAAATGSVLMAKVLLSPLVILVLWLVPLIICRVWCEMHPYVPARWLAAAQRRSAATSSRQRWIAYAVKPVPIPIGFCGEVR